MTNQKLLKIINPLLAITVLVQIVSIVLFKHAGIRGAIGVHAAAGLFLVMLVVTHLVLNRQWFKTAFSNNSKKS